LSTPDPQHFWPNVHAQFDGGRMDGFFTQAQSVTGDGRNAIGYYTENALPFYYGLLADSALCANYLCSVLGPTWTTRFYLMSDRLSTPDPQHFWPNVHAQFDGGLMDGFFTQAQSVTGDGRNAIGYYTENALPFYYGLLADSALCANYFCSVLGPTWPNRFYLM